MSTISMEASVQAFQTEPATHAPIVRRRPCRFHVAQTLDEVMEGWRLLYDAYVRVGFIRDHVFRLHTVEQAIGDHTAVIVARVGGETAGTISSIMDSPLGLPLDEVYHEELNAFRREGRRMVEIGLLGERRHPLQDDSRTFPMAFELMRYAFYFAMHCNVTDFICGIPPRRAKLYSRYLGFKTIGEEKSYATVTDNPVVLQHVTTEHLLSFPKRYRAIRYFFENPVPAEAFAHRFGFDEHQMVGSPLADYLRWKGAHHHAVLAA